MYTTMEIHARYKVQTYRQEAEQDRLAKLAKSGQDTVTVGKRTITGLVRYALSLLTLVGFRLSMN